MTVNVLPEAEAEYLEAARWYNSRQRGLGGEFLDALETALTQIGAQPQQFALLETVHLRDREIRRCVLRRFPYVVVFEVAGEEVRIVAVAHVRRRPNYWLKLRTTRARRPRHRDARRRSQVQ